MSLHQCKRFCVLGGLFSAALLAAGCGGTLLASDTGNLTDLLTQLGVSEDTTIGELLDQVSVAEVASTVAQLTADARPALTNEQLAELDALAEQLDTGEITEEEYRDAMRELIGDLPAMPGGGLHGSGHGDHGMGPGGPPPPPPDLTEEQQQAFDEIIASAYEDIDALHAAAEEDFRALLTEEQVALYDELPPLFPVHGEGGPRPHGPPADGSPLDRLAEELSLSAEQHAAAEEIFAALRDAVERGTSRRAKRSTRCSVRTNRPTGGPWPRVAPNPRAAAAARTRGR